MAERRDDAAEIGRRAAEEAIGSARKGARYFGDQLRDTAQSVLKQQQDRAADTVHGFADALRRTADSLESEENRAFARYADQAAVQIDRLSETLRARQLADLLAEAEDFARRQPSLFIVGAVAVGFVIGRILAQPAAGGSPPQGYAATGGEHAFHEAEPPLEAEPSFSHVEPL